MYAHYFVSAQIYFEHSAFFLERRPRAIVLAGGENLPQLSGVPTLNIYQSEKDLVKSILRMHEHGHHGGKHPQGEPTVNSHDLQKIQEMHPGYKVKELYALQIKNKVTYQAIVGMRKGFFTKKWKKMHLMNFETDSKFIDEIEL